jgi:hypothetical protein
VPSSVRAFDAMNGIFSSFCTLTGKFSAPQAGAGFREAR